MANNPPCNNRGENNKLSIFSRMGFTKPVAHGHQYTAQEVFSLPIFHTALLGRSLPNPMPQSFIFSVCYQATRESELRHSRFA